MAWTNWGSPSPSPYMPPQFGNPAPPQPAAPANSSGGWNGAAGGGRPTTARPAPASSAPPPAAGYNPDFSGGLLSGPGYGEQFYDQHKNEYGAPTNAASYWQGIQGQFTTPYNTDPFNQAYNSYLFGMGNGGGPLQGTQGAYNSQKQMQGGPGSGEQAAGAAQSYFGQQGTGEQYIGNVMGSGYFQQPGQAESYYDQNRGFFAAPGQGEQWVGQNLGQFKDQGAAETNYFDTRRTLGDINYGQQGIDLVNKGSQDAHNTLGYFNDTRDFAKGNPLQDEYNQYFAGGLRDKSYSEKMLESGTGGLIDPYARAQEKQSKALNDQLAARGQYGSGLAVRGQEELGADIGAAEARDRIALAQQADQARLGRTGAAQSFAGAAGQEALQRRGFGLQAAGAADESQRGLMGLGLQAQGLASGEALSKVGLQTGAATAAENAMLQRLTGAGNLALGAQGAATNRIVGGSNVASNAQQAGLLRTNAGINAAGTQQELGMSRNNNLLNAGVQGQNLQMDRLFKGGQLGLQADQSEMQRQQDLLQGGKYFQDVNRDAYATNRDTQSKAFDINTSLDTQREGRLLDAQSMATGAQNSMENRLRNGQQDIFQAANAQATAVLGALDSASREQFQAQISDIEAQAAAGKISQQYAQSQIDQVLESARTLIKAQGSK